MTDGQRETSECVSGYGRIAAAVGDSRDGERPVLDSMDSIDERRGEEGYG